MGSSKTNLAIFEVYAMFAPVDGVLRGVIVDIHAGDYA
jgi:hypothetical protein